VYVSSTRRATFGSKLIPSYHSASKQPHQSYYPPNQPPPTTACQHNDNSHPQIQTPFAPPIPAIPVLPPSFQGPSTSARHRCYESSRQPCGIFLSSRRSFGFGFGFREWLQRSSESARTMPGPFAVIVPASTGPNPVHVCNRCHPRSLARGPDTPSRFYPFASSPRFFSSPRVWVSVPYPAAHPLCTLLFFLVWPKLSVHALYPQTWSRRTHLQERVRWRQPWTRLHTSSDY